VVTTVVVCTALFLLQQQTQQSTIEMIMIMGRTTPITMPTMAMVLITSTTGVIPTVVAGFVQAPTVLPQVSVEVQLHTQFAVEQVLEVSQQVAAKPSLVAQTWTVPKFELQQAGVMQPVIVQVFGD